MRRSRGQIADKQQPRTSRTRLSVMSYTDPRMSGITAPGFGEAVSDQELVRRAQAKKQAAPRGVVVRFMDGTSVTLKTGAAWRIGGYNLYVYGAGEVEDENVIGSFLVEHVLGVHFLNA